MQMKLSASSFLPIFFLGTDFCKIWPTLFSRIVWLNVSLYKKRGNYLQKFIKRLCNTNSVHQINSILPSFCQNNYLHYLNVPLPLYTLLSNLLSPLWYSTDIHHRPQQVIDKLNISKSCCSSIRSQTCALPKQLNRA